MVDVSKCQKMVDEARTFASLLVSLVYVLWRLLMFTNSFIKTVLTYSSVFV